MRGEDMDGKEALTFGALVLALGICIGVLIGVWVERWRMVDEATKHGHGRYFLDERSERRWEWLPRSH